MSWLYLAFSIVGAVLTYNMFRPIGGGARRTVFGFFAGWLWGELALHATAVLVVGTLFFAWMGALDSVIGELGLLVTIVSGVALVRGYRGGLAAAPLVERALRVGFGSAYAERIRPELREQFEYGVRWRPILRPFPIRHPEVECVRDIPFWRERGVTLKLDVYRHRSMPAGCPVLLQIHGGGWVIGDKREQALPLMNHLAARGWVCVSANYRLSPHATFPDHLIDVKRAMKWVRENVANYGGDSNFLIVTGGSAGGHLAALVGLTANDPEYQPGFEDVDTGVNGCVPVYGVYDFTDRRGLRSDDGLARILEEQVMKGSLEEIPEAYRKASPIDRIRVDAPPFMVVHGELDTLVPVDEARHFTESLRSLSTAPVVYVEVAGAQHAFELFPSLRSQAVVDGIERFSSYLYSRYLDGVARVGDEDERRMRHEGTAPERLDGDASSASPSEPSPKTQPSVHTPAAKKASVRRTVKRASKRASKPVGKPVSKKEQSKASTVKKRETKATSATKKTATGRKSGSRSGRSADATQPSSGEAHAPSRRRRLRSEDDDGGSARRAAGD